MTASDFWWARSHLAEGRARLEQALARVTEPTPPRAEALLGLGRIVASQGDLAAGETWLRQSEALARALNMPELLWQVLFEVGQTVDFAGDDERAIPLYEAALEVARALDDAPGASHALWALSEVAYGRGDLEITEQLGQEAIALLRPAGNAFMLSMCLATIGEVALARGDVSGAITHYREAFDLAKGIEMDWAIASALTGFAATAAHGGDYHAAAQLLGACETMREASNQQRIATFHHHAQTTNAVRAALGDEAFAEAWAAGRVLSAEDAVDLPQALGIYE